jgi:predicted glutamine amidotransferase
MCLVLAPRAVIGGKQMRRAPAKEGGMSRLFAVVINDPQRLACALYPTRETLVAKSAPEGWGLACYQGGEVLLQRHPKPRNQPLDFFQQVKDLRTDYVVGHVMDPGTLAKLENTQPFRFRSWVYAQSGGMELAEARAAILEHVPDFLRRNIRAQTGAEHLFYVLLSFLHDANKLDDPNLRVADAAAALRGALLLASRMAAKTQAPPPSMNVAATNGRILLAARSGKPMWWRQVSGIADCRLCGETLPEEARRDRRKTSHEHVRAVLIASEPEKPPTEEGWEEIPDGTIVGVTRDLQKSLVSLKAD